MSATPREFRGVQEASRFFAVQKVPKPPAVKPVKHDVPALVIPARHEQLRMQSNTPRRTLLTLPPIQPHGSRKRQPPQPHQRFHGSVTPRNEVSASAASGAVDPHSGPHTARALDSVVPLPKLTFSTTASIDQFHATAATTLAPSERRRDLARFRSRLNDYLDEEDEDESRRAAGISRQRSEIDSFEARHGSSGGGGRLAPSASQSEHHTVTTIDEEASTRVLKVMFQLNLTRNSSIIARLKDLDHEYLHRKVLHELGYKKQMSRDEFFVLMCKVLKDDYINKRDCMTLFSVFDDDKSGLVDAVEFVSGFMTLIAAGENDIAFKFIHTVLDARGEKAIVNAFISRFELQLLVKAAQHHFADDKDVVRLLEQVPSAFNFSHHLGRIPIMQFRDKVINDEDLCAIFSALPNPSRPAKEAAASAVADAAKGRSRSEKAVSLAGSEMAGLREEHHLQHILADQYMSQNHEAQHKAEEHDSPRWWVSGGIVYRASDSNPYGEPVFLKEGEKRK